MCPNRGLKSTAFELFVRLLTPGHKFNPVRLRFLYHFFCIEVVLCVDPHIFQGYRVKFFATDHLIDFYSEADDETTLYLRSNDTPFIILGKGGGVF